ncbi:hypothetical protein Tco_0871438, partial [Tanacetum coccineum]
MTTLAEFMIFSGGDNRPPMLEKALYDSWKSRMELTKKYVELSALEKIQADCDLKATNIILQGLPPDVYAHINHHRVSKDLWERVQLLMQGTSLTKQERECKLYDEFDKFAHINGESLHHYYLRFTQLINDMNIYKMKLEQFQVNTKFLNSLPPEWSKFVTDVKLVRDLHTTNFDQLNAYLEQHELHANEVLQSSSYGLMLLVADQVVLSEVPYSDNTHNDMLNQTVQDTNSSTQQEAMILSVFEQLSNQVTNYNKVNKDNLIANESLSAELERYKEWVKLLEERQNVDLRKKELLTKTFNIFKNESKEKEAKNIDTEIALEKKVKEMDNIVCKMGQSAQTMHMLTKPQVFYDNNLKKALGFQIPFYLKKAQQIRPMLYDGNVIAKETSVISIADSEETLMLQEESRSKMLLKQSDPMVLEKKVNIKPINYAELNRLSKDFGKHFVPQYELSDEQALHAITDQSASLPIKIEAPRELPKMEVVVQQYHVEKQCFEIQKKQFLIDNDWLLDQIISQDIVNIVVNSSVDVNTSVKVNSSIVMNDSVNYNNTSVNQTEPSFDQLFELNNLKAELQVKDITIEKLKANIKRLTKTSTTNSVKKDIDEIKTINIELEHRVRKLIAENGHLKQTYKQLYDSIKPSCIRAKEHAESLVNQLNQKSVEITDLNAQLQEKVFVITTLKNDLRKFKGKDIVNNSAQVLNTTPGMYKLDLVILAPKDNNNKETHEYYLKHTTEQAVILRDIVEQAKSRNPLDSASYSAYIY